MIVTAYPKMQQPASTLFGFFVGNPISNKMISGVFEEIFPLQLLTLLLTLVFYIDRRNVVPKTQILARPTILMPWCSILREHTLTAINEVRYKEITLAFVAISLRDRGRADGAACGGMFCLNWGISNTFCVKPWRQPSKSSWRTSTFALVWRERLQRTKSWCRKGRQSTNSLLPHVYILPTPFQVLVMVVSFEGVHSD